MKTGVNTIMTMFLKLIIEYDYRFSITKSGEFIFEKDGTSAIVNVEEYYNEIIKENK